MRKSCKIMMLLYYKINYASTLHYTGAIDHPDCIRNNVTTEYHQNYASVTKVSSGIGVSSGIWLSSGTQLSSDLLPIWYQFVKTLNISVLEGKFLYHAHIGFIQTYLHWINSHSYCKPVGSTSHNPKPTQHDKVSLVKFCMISYVILQDTHNG